jgi:hypothetical protein
MSQVIYEDLLNIKRKGDPEVSYPLSYVRNHWNPEPVCNKSHFVSLFCLYWYFFNLLNLFWHTNKNLCFYAEVNLYILSLFLPVGGTYFHGIGFYLKLLIFVLFLETRKVNWRVISRTIAPSFSHIYIYIIGYIDIFLIY